jgi:OFA family oxalate/formate antiporter-like MFS transporter
MLKKIQNLFYGWWIVIASFVLLVITGGTALYGFTAFFNPISSEMKWGSAAISFAFSLRSIEGGIFQPLIGIFVERVGVRKCIFAGIALMGFSLFLLSRMTTLTIFYVGFVLLSLGFTMAAGIAEYTAVANWFRKRRSLALGLLTTGWGVSGLMTPIIAMMIRSVGWRETMFLLCPFILMIGIPLSFVIRDRPQSFGMQPDGVILEGNHTDTAKFQEGEPGLTLKEGLKTRTFWMLFLYAFCVQFAFSTIPVQEMPHLINVGISEKLAALTMAGFSLTTLVGRLFISWLGDTYSKKRLLIVSAAMQAIGFFIYANISRAWMIIPFILLYGPGFGATTPLLPGIQADYFGVRSFASIRGMMSIAFSAPGIIAPVFAGWIFDNYHSYTIAFQIYAAMAALGIVALMMIPKRKI